jgi:hypothetical protein
MANEFLTSKQVVEKMLENVRAFAEATGLTLEESFQLWAYRMQCTLGGFPRSAEREKELAPLMEKAGIRFKPLP